MDQGTIEEVLEARAQALDAARPEVVAARHACGRLTARERIDSLLDAGSFVEYGVLAEGSPDAPGEAPADGVVAGAGRIDGQPVVVASYDVTVHAGTQSRINDNKISKMIYLAREHRWPLVCFVDGEGARQPTYAGARPYPGVGRGAFGLFDGLAELSGWVPTVAIISGRALSGHASMAMLSDFVVATQGSSLGMAASAVGAESELPVEAHEEMGDIDLLVEDEPAAIAAARRYLSYYLCQLPTGTPSPSAAMIRTIVPESRRRAYDVRRVIEAVADADSVLELRPNWAKSLVTAFGRLDGRSVGFFANQPMSAMGGAIDAEAADKISRFVELCNAYEFALVSFVDNPGYMIGPAAERNGIARHHARPLAALHHRTVPLYSVQIRKAYGLGPYAMAGFGSSRLVSEQRLAWPSVETGGMSLEGAASLVRRREMQAAETPEQVRAIRDDYAATVRALNSGLRAGRLYSFDDIIDPAETRERIISMLNMTERRQHATKKHYIDPV